MVIIGLVVFPLDGKHGDSVMLDQRGRHIILCAQRIRSTQPHRGATGLEGLYESSRLRGYMKAGPKACPS